MIAVEAISTSGAADSMKWVTAKSRTSGKVATQVKLNVAVRVNGKGDIPTRQLRDDVTRHTAGDGRLGRELEGEDDEVGNDRQQHDLIQRADAERGRALNDAPEVRRRETQTKAEHDDDDGQLEKRRDEHVHLLCPHTPTRGTLLDLPEQAGARRPLTRYGRRSRYPASDLR